jgi:hypothetical protein
VHRAGGGLEVLELVDPGKLPWVAPTWRVRCPDCAKAYEVKGALRQIVIRKRCRACADARRAAKKKPTAARVPRPDGLPSEEAFAHGARARYVIGCRCDECRAANAAYQRGRAKLKRLGQGDPLVPAGRVRRHLANLSAAGIGRDTVADIAGVPPSTLDALRTGRSKQLRKATEAKILAVTREATHDAKLVSPAGTERRIRELLGQGYTVEGLARRLGYTGAMPRLQFLGRKRITAKTEARVARLHRELLEGRLSA